VLNRDSIYTLSAHIKCITAHFKDIKMHEAIYLIFDYKATLVNEAMLKIDIERNLNGNYTILRINMHLHFKFHYP